MSDLACVIVNWNTRELLLSCLRALASLAADGTAEVVVVDNCSGDGSAEAVARDFPSVRLIRNCVNIGFARAANQGIEATTAPILCLLNPDLVLRPEPLRSCLKQITDHPAVGALSPVLLDAEGRRWRYPERFPSLPAMILGGRCEDPPSPFGNLEDVDWLPGACLFLRRSALGNVGLLDGRFFLYKEDVDLCLRLRRSGYSVVRFHGVSVRHLVAQSTRRNGGREADRARVEGFRSTYLYVEKHRGKTAARVVASLLRVGLGARIVKAFCMHAITGDASQREKLAWMCRAVVEMDRKAA